MNKRFVLQRIILGNLPMLGISYQGRKKDEEYKAKFSCKDEMKNVMKVALRYGIRLFAASSHGFNELVPTHLEAIEEIEKEEEAKVSLIVCIGIPIEFRGKSVNVYRRWKTHLTYESKEFGKKVVNRVFEDPILNCRLEWREKLNFAKPYKPKKLERDLRINWVLLEEAVERISHYRVGWIEPGSETDFLAISRIDLLEELLDRTHEYGYRALLGSHHFGATMPIIEERRVKRFEGYITPVNKLGVMMFPTQREAENAVRKAREAGRLIVGIKPFAGGRIIPEEALNHVYKKMEVDSCMVGVGSIEEAEKDLQVAKDILGATDNSWKEQT